MKRVSVIGGGRMGEALLGGLVHAGWDPGSLRVCEVHQARRAEISDLLGVAAYDNVAQATSGAEVIVLAVKPQDFDPVLAELRHAWEPGAVVVSIAAGITTAYIESRLPEGVSVIRAMPNTPALLREGATAIAPGLHAIDQDMAAADDVLSAVSKVVHLAEKHLDAVTGVSGSGPAYVFYLAECLIEAAVGVGLTREVAIELTTQTIFGAARMLQETSKHPVELREEVTSPGGTTVAAMRVLERDGVKNAFLDAVAAATQRSGELAAEHD